MLQTLKVKDFALIDDIQIDFTSGLTALTGETGSGKSILLESLSLLFGKRSDADLIRHNAPRATVIGTFILNSVQQELLSLPNKITITRQIDRSGKHFVKINDELVTLAKLKEVAQTIGSIHAQTDTYLLFDKQSYLKLIDQMNPNLVAPLLSNYLIKRDNYLQALAKFNNLAAKKEESIERIEILEHQINELEALNLKLDQKEQLDELINKLSNFDKIKQSLILSYSSLENETFSLDSIYQAYQMLNKISEYDLAYQTLSEQTEAAYYQLDAVKQEIKSLLDNFDFDENEFQGYQERSYEIAKIEAKYKKDNNTLVAYLADIKQELELITDYDSYVNKAQDLVNQTKKIAFDAGLKLHLHRKNTASNLAKLLTDNLVQLNLEKALFEIRFEPINDNTSLGEEGLDEVDFYISLNEGEPLKPLAKVASGGEKARFMFALKSIYAKASNLSLLVLDEIDIGISGKTAALVAEKMLLLSSELQLIVITHLPQVAARADNHFLITKTKINNRMTTNISLLNYDSRVEAIALMLSDEQISSFAIEQAKMLLKK